MQVGFVLPLALFALLPVWGLIWWWYRRRRPPVRPIAGIWLWQQAKQKGQAKRRFDWRLFLLLLAATLCVLALSAPKVSIELPGELIVVLDVSASMGASDVKPTRLEHAKEVARKFLEPSPRAVLVVAGDRVEAYGPAKGPSLISKLSDIKAESRSANLTLGTARGRQRLPTAKTLVISDDAPPPDADAYVNVAGSGQNIGISAVAPGFIALANGGPGRWTGQVLVDGKPYSVNVPAGGYSTLEVPQGSFEARMAGSDALAIDDRATFGRRLVRVDFAGKAPALQRLLGVLGTARGQPAEINFEIGTPTKNPAEYTVYFAKQSGPNALVYDLERTQGVLRGVELVGYRLPVPPNPKGSDWRPLATSVDGKVVAWFAPQGLYLPPVESLQDLPAFPVLLYNLIAPRSELRSGLLTPSESMLPRPRPNIALPPALTLWLAPWLALLAAALLGLEGWFFGRRVLNSSSERRVLER